jgi:aspartate/methionine/tyrosine aminotransferase
MTRGPRSREKIMNRSRRMDDITSFIVMDVLEEAHGMERAGEDIVHLEVGEPDFAPPEAVVEASCRAAAGGCTHYTHSLGLVELREAISAWYLRTYGVTVDPGCVVVTPGTSGAFLSAMAVLMDPGEKIAFMDPGYPCYPNFARLLGLAPVTIPVDSEDGFVPRRERVLAAVKEGAGTLLVASPANPTGTVLPGETLEWLAGLPVSLISDEIYHGLIYGGGHGHTALEYNPDVVVINGLSKRMAMTGLRIGWAVVPPGLVREFQKLNQNLFICADSVSQHAAVAALSDPSCEEAALRMRDTYAERRGVLLRGLERLGFVLHHEPEGAFYVFADCTPFSRDSFEFTRRMLREAKVAATPGVDFGRHRTSNFVRFAYTIDVARIEEGLKRLSAWLGGRE